MATTKTITNSKTFYPSGHNTSNTSTGTVSSISNAYNSSSNTTYATVATNTTQNGSSYISFTFDLSAIPSSATINSVACKVKACMSSTQQRYTTAFVAQLYNGTTAMGSSLSIGRVTTATATAISSTGTWTRTTLDDLELRYTHTRGQSSTAVSMYIYGADLTISYSYETVVYTVTITSTGDGTTNPTGEQSVNANETLDITCIPTYTASKVTVIDNDVDVSSQLINIGGETSTADTGDSTTITSVISSYDTASNVTGTYYQSAVGNGSDTTTTSTNNNYCSDNNSTATIFYNFDLSSVPENVTITNVTCSVKGHEESSSSSSETALCQLYKGSTAVGTGVSFTSTSDEVITITDTGDWTYDDLSNLKLGFTIGYYGGNVTGATVSVTYMDLGESGVGYLYSLTSVTADHTISVTYGEVTKYNVSISIKNGTITSPTENPTEIAETQNLKIVFNGDEGAVFKSMTINDSSVTPTYYGTPPQKDVSWSVSTSFGEYTTGGTTYSISNVNDGNQSTWFWSNEVQSVGKYVLITFSEPVVLNSFSEVATGSDTDYPKSNCQLQVSTDNSEWETVGTFSDDSQTQTISSIGKTCQYVRMYIATAADYWFVVNEITMDYDIIDETFTPYYEYTISNITSEKSVVIIFKNSDGVFLKISSNTWQEAASLFKKTDTGWKEIEPDDFYSLVKDKKIHFGN